jgi:type IX secretion system PorP/SprF family membrane protein
MFVSKYKFDEFCISMLKISHIYYLIFALLYIVGTQSVKGQDIVFSQFEQVASYYNPSYAGFERELGAGLTVRNQWGNTNGNYFYSYVFGDVFLEEQRSGIGVDLSYSSANSGGNTILTLGGRYNYHLKINNKWTSAVGLSASYASVKMNGDNFIFEDQLNPNGSSTVTAENIGAIQNRGYLDLGIGTVFYIKEQTELSLGIKHINFPSLKSLNDQRTPIRPMISLFMKHRIKIAGSFYRPNSNKVYILPSLLLLRQAQFSQMRIGSAVEIELVQLGVFYKGGFGKLDGLYSKNDAIVFFGALKTDSFNMTYSYDMSISAQRIPTSSHEITVIYIKKSNKIAGRRKPKKRR